MWPFSSSTAKTWSKRSIPVTAEERVYTLFFVRMPPFNLKTKVNVRELYTRQMRSGSRVIDIPDEEGNVVASINAEALAWVLEGFVGPANRGNNGSE